MAIACRSGLAQGVAIALLSATASPRAVAQDLGPVTTAEEAGDLDDLQNPQGLPGRENAPRTREEPPPPEPATREWFGHRPWWEWDRATGDWAGARTTLEDAGLTLAASYTFEWSSVYRGGLKRGASTRSLFDANLTLDLEPKFGIEGGSVYADFYSTDDGHPGGSLDVGDFQWFTNLQTEKNVDQLAELWYEQWLLDRRFRVKLGKIDAWTEFGFVNAGADFINNSAAISPTIFPIPSYPDPATGLVAFAYPTDRVYVGAGFFDGAATVDGVPTGSRGPSTFFHNDVSDDWFWIAEAGLTWSSLGPVAEGRLALGGWFHTGEFETFVGGTEQGTSGFYAIAEQRLWTPEPDADSPRGLAVFVQLGLADDKVSDAAAHYAAGLALTGVFDCRADDATGIYVSTVELSEDAGYLANETAVEVFYKFQVTPFFWIKPDLHYIFNPGGDPAIEDALVGALRAEISF
jgi:porin